MFSKSASLLMLAAASLALPALGRERWYERDGKSVWLHPRRFGQEHPAVIEKLSAACAGQVCGVLAGSAISTLLAASPECAQQDKADEIIEASRQFDAATQANMIALAKEFRQAEKNTPPAFDTNPPTPRNSVFCQQAPRNAELNGLVQAQDPANDAIHFFDPATKATVLLDSQPNTRPFGGAAAPAAPEASSTSAAIEDTATTTTAAPEATSECPAPVTVTVTAGAAATTTAAAPAATTSAAAAPAAGNLQNFAGALGGVTPPTVTDLGNGKFQVTGNAVFNNLTSALIRSCDVQNNQCANKFNAGDKSIGSVGNCNAQQATCIAQANA